MPEENQITLHDQITEAARDAIAQALERHRKLGESIAVWQDGKVVVLSSDQIPLPHETPSSSASYTPQEPGMDSTV
ncbi:MAG: hypothetical protein MUF49_02525 [Oculatellaceae cyanobacterium Prado106]|nr:hypothetical protein [Oculatellaceae cyanobacterium Prado106]